MVDRGQQIHETTIKSVLQSMNPDIHFDMGAKLNIYHPRMDEWQGIFVSGRHITSMGRGWLPEYNVYGTSTAPDGTVYRTHLKEIGWRHTLEGLVRCNVPHVTWDKLTLALGVDRKKFEGNPRELELA